MTFSEQMDKFMRELGCTANELSAHCKVSESTISRYRSGGRTPKFDSAQMNGLIDAFVAIANEQGLSDAYNEESVRRAFRIAVLGVDLDIKEFAGRLDKLITGLGLSVAKVAPEIGYDASYISRMRKGQRFPADVTAFITALADWMEANLKTEDERKKAAATLGASEDEADKPGEIKNAVCAYLGMVSEEAAPEPVEEKPQEPEAVPEEAVPEPVEEEKPQEQEAEPEEAVSEPVEEEKPQEQEAEPEEVVPEPVEEKLQEPEAVPEEAVPEPEEPGETAKCLSEFLLRLDRFRLKEYIHNNVFDTIPVGPFALPQFGVKSYFGQRGIRQMLGEFAKRTLQMPTKEDVWIYTDIPIERLKEIPGLEDEWFGFLNRMMLDRELHIHILYDMGAKKEEQIKELNKWLPLLSTGCLHLYATKATNESSFSYLLMQSAGGMVDGYCVHEDLSCGSYRLSTAEKEMTEGRVRMQALFERASSVCDVYGFRNSRPFLRMLKDNAKNGGEFERISPGLPLFAMSEELYKEVLRKNGVDALWTGRAMEHFNRQKKLASITLRNGTLTDRISVLSEEDFVKGGCTLFTFGFLEIPLSYDYGDYMRHLEETKAYAARETNYNVIFEADAVYEKMGVIIAKDRWMAVAKEDMLPLRMVLNSNNETI